MAKKKKSQRRRNFAYSSSTSTAAPVQPKPARASEPSARTEPLKQKQPAVVTSTDVGKMDYLRQDLKMIGILAGSAVVLEVVLWILLRHTDFGRSLFGI